MGLGALEPLSRLISHEDKIVQKKAVMALGVMASNSKYSRKIKNKLKECLATWFLFTVYLSF